MERQGQDEQIVVAGEYEIGTAAEGESEELVVAGVAAVGEGVGDKNQLGK